MKLITYLPHGEIPDSRGFAPALVAQNLAAQFREVSNLHVCASEALPVGGSHDAQWGDIIRIKEGALYRRLFRKWTKLDPYPMYRRLAKISNEYRPDIVHIHQLEFPVDEFRSCLNSPVKIIIHGHTIRSHDPCLGEADLYLAASKHIAAGLIAGGYPANKMRVLYNGVDTETFAPATQAEKSALRTKAQFAENSKIVVFFGRKQEVKGFDLFLQSIEALAPRFPEILAISVGATPLNTRDDTSFERCQKLKQSLIDQGVLRDYPPLPHHELADILRLSDVAVLPSRDEPQGMAMIEAMAAGLIVISGNVGGIRESIETNATGLLVDALESGNPVLGPLANVLEQIETYRNLGNNARLVAEQRFSWPKLSNELEQIYQAIA